MKSLKKTTNFTIDHFGKGGHYHIIYLNDEAGYGMCAMSENHQHEIEYVPPVPAVEPQYDEQGNQISEGQPEQAGFFRILPDPLDGHTHEPEEYEIKQQKSKENKEDIIRDVYDLFKEWTELEGDSRKKGIESDGFYSGEAQWDEATKRDLAGLNRACVTINRIQRHIDELKGIQVQQRTDITYLPVEGGDAVVADVLNIVSKQLLDQCFYQREKSKIFHDQVVPGRGLINLYVSFQNDLRGELVVERYPWSQAVFGPHEKEDLSDCEGLIKHRMYSMAKLTQLWGDKAKDIQKDFTSFLERSKEHTTYEHDQYAHSDNVYPIAPMSIGDSAMVDIAKKEYRVLECWRKKYVKIPVAVHDTDDAFINCWGWEKKDLDAVKSLGFYVVQKPSTKIRITKVAGGVLLSDEDPADLAVDDFHLIPVYAYKHGDKFWGKVEIAKDPQREVNYRRSQAIDIGNKMISYSYFVTDETFKSEEELNKFKQNSTSPGGIYHLALGQERPQKEEGAKFPTEVAELMNIAQSEVETLINVSVEPGGANESGAAFLNKQKQKLTANEFLFDNLSFAEQKLGRLLVPLIQRYYTPERITRIVNFYAQTKEITLNGKPLESFTDAYLIETLENADLTKYDVQVSESAYSPTIRMATFQLLTEMASKGVQITPDMLIQFAPIPEEQRQQMLQTLASQSEQAAQSESDSQTAEVAKTLFAKGVFPKNMLDKFGIAPEEVPGIQQGELQERPPAQSFQNNGTIPAEYP